MSDNITLPREVVEKAVKAFENGCPPTCENGMVDSGGFHPWGQPALVPCPACLAFEHLRTALAAEQPKPEPVAWMDRFGSVVLGKGPYETFTTPLYTFPPDAPTVKESLTHPGYIIGSHWLETAYSRICAGEAEADVLRDCGWERVNDAEALRRDAERLRELLRDTTLHLGAAVDLLKRGGRKAVASDKMFVQMLTDYTKSFERGRAALRREDV